MTQDKPPSAATITATEGGTSSSDLFPVVYFCWWILPQATSTELISRIGGWLEILGKEGILGLAEAVPIRPETLALKNPKQTNAIQAITRAFFMIFPSWVKDYAGNAGITIQGTNGKGEVALVRELNSQVVICRDLHFPFASCDLPFVIARSAKQQ